MAFGRPKARLYDKDLLAFTEQLKERNPQITHQELAIESGYYSYAEGKLIPLVDEYFDNLLNFKLKQHNRIIQPGAKPKHRLKVGVKETIVIGRSYVRMAGLKPNTIMRISICERGKIILQPIRNNETKKAN